MSGKITKKTTPTDKYMLVYPSSTVSSSVWDPTKAKAWAEKLQYYVLVNSKTKDGKAKTSHTQATLPVKVTGILEEKVKMIKNKLGVKEPKPVKQKIFLPYIPVSYLVSIAKELKFGDEEAEKLKRRLNAVSVDLGIKYNGVATKHLPVRIGGHIDKVAPALRDFGLDFAFKTNPNSTGQVINKYNIDIIDKFSFHGDLAFNNHQFRANVSDDPTWVENHIYGKIWTDEHDEQAKLSLYFKIEGADGKEITIDRFHYVTKYLFREDKKEDFDRNFLYSNEAVPKKLTPIEGRATVDVKKSTIADTLADQLAGPNKISNTTRLVDGKTVPDKSVYFSINKKGTLSLDKRSWKNKQESVKEGYLLPKFKFAAAKLGQELAVNADGNTDVYIALVRRTKVPVVDSDGKVVKDANGKVSETNLRDVSYDANETLKLFKKAFQSLIVNSDKFFATAERELPAAIAKSAAEFTKKKESVERTFHTGLGSAAAAESQSIPAAEIPQVGPPKEASEAEEIDL